MALSREHKFINDYIKKRVGECVSGDEIKSKNIICCNEDVLFVWNPNTKKLVSFLLKGKHADTYQEFCPIDPPIFEVTSILVSPTRTKIVLWGREGVCVMELPWILGRLTDTQGQSSIVKCTTLSKNSFESKIAEIYQVRFHPGSMNDNHLLVLVSTNSLRLYFLDSEQGEHYIVLISQQKSSSSYVAQDVLIDFDFCLPAAIQGADIKETIWPIMILRGNGDLYCVETSLNFQETQKLGEPLSMFPAADDNYGLEACALLILPTLPSFVVIATCSGVIYHFVLLQSHLEDDNEQSVRALYSLESIKIELGIQLNAFLDTSYSCPIFLHTDPVCRSRYFCSHNAGIHAVSVPFINYMENLFSSKDYDPCSNIHYSAVEYLVCTRTKSSPVLPVCGITILPTPPYLLVLLADQSLITVPLKLVDIDPNFTASETTSTEDVTPLKAVLQEPFGKYINQLLSENQTNRQLILKLNKQSSFSAQECLALVSRSIALLKKQYFSTYDTVRDEIDKRILLLNATKDLQYRDIIKIEGKKSFLTTNAENLAEKYEDLKDRQQILTKRVEALLVKVLQNDHVESVAEKKMKNDLLQIKDKVSQYQKTISEVREKLDYQRFKIKERGGYNKTKDLRLDDKKIHTLKKNLLRTSQDIASVINTVNTLKKQQNSLFRC